MAGSFLSSAGPSSHAGDALSRASSDAFSVLSGPSSPRIASSRPPWLSSSPAPEGADVVTSASGWHGKLTARSGALMGSLRPNWRALWNTQLMKGSGLGKGSAAAAPASAAGKVGPLQFELDDVAEHGTFQQADVRRLRWGRDGGTVARAPVQQLLTTYELKVCTRLQTMHMRHVHWQISQHRPGPVARLSAALARTLLPTKHCCDAFPATVY